MKLGKYKHFKGGEYEVIGIGKHTENLEDFVIYKSLYSKGEFKKGTLWLRPKDDFEGYKILNNKKIKRFKLIKN